MYRVSVAELAKNVASPHVGGLGEKGRTEKRDGRGKRDRQAGRQAGGDEAALKGRYTVCG